MSPVILYCCKGWAHLCYAIWSIRSLQRFDYRAIEVMVASTEEEAFFREHCPDVFCRVIAADAQQYPAFSYKPFVLTQYWQQGGLQHPAEELVICDADVLWKQDPRPLFQRFAGKNWVHKITAVNPKDYARHLTEIPPTNIGLVTTWYYAQRHPIARYPNFRLNAGLFMLPVSVFPRMLARWMEVIYALPPAEMRMSEALMSLVYAEMELTPVCDREDIKHLGVEQAETALPLLPFQAVERNAVTEWSGYQTAKHYFGSQRQQLMNDANAMGLDADQLERVVRQDLRRKQIHRILHAPGKHLRWLRQKLTASFQGAAS